MDILVINGGVRPQSQTKKVALSLYSMLEEKKLHSSFADLAVLDIPILGKSHSTSDVEWLRREIRKTKGLILVTPEYHSGLSGALKNALDWMNIDDVKQKCCALVGVCGGVNSFNATNQLRCVMGGLHAWVLPRDFIVAQSANAIDESGRLSDACLQARAERFVIELMEAL